MVELKFTKKRIQIPIDELDIDTLVDEAMSVTEEEEDEDEETPVLKQSPPEDDPPQYPLYLFLIQLYLVIFSTSGLGIGLVGLGISAFTSCWWGPYLLNMIALSLLAYHGMYLWTSDQEEEREFQLIYNQYVINGQEPPMEVVYVLLYLYSIPHVFCALCMGIMFSFLPLSFFLVVLSLYLAVLLPVKYFRAQRSETKGPSR